MAPTDYELRQAGSWQEAEALGRWLAGEPYEELDDDNTPYCSVCSGVGHSAGEFGDYCPSGKPAGWFDPSPAHDLC